MNSPATKRLTWFKSQADDANTTWEAWSGAHEHGIRFRYRLAQKLCDDKVLWTDRDSDREVRGAVATYLDSLDDLKALCEATEAGLREVLNDSVTECDGEVA